MLRTSRCELLGIINPQLAWNTVSKGRHRAPRRPRTSFLADTKPKAEIKHLNRNDNPVDNDVNCNEMTISESEKMGVTLLGHHFNGSLEGVPIKKRLLLAQSPSSPQGSPSNSYEISNHVPEIPGSHHVNQEPDSPSLIRNSAVGDCADFSGISILAAAACSSRFGDDFLDTEPSIFKDEDHTSAQIVSMGVGIDKEELSDANVSESKAELSEKPVAVLGSSAMDDRSYTGIVHLLDENISSSNNTEVVSSKASPKSEPFARNNKFHWDLNKEMDAWELPYDEDAELVDGSSDDVCKKGSYKVGLYTDSGGEKTELCLSNTCHVSSVNVNEAVTFESTQICASIEHGDIITRQHTSDEESGNHCSSAGDSEFSHKQFIGNGIKPSLTQLSVSASIDHVLDQTVSPEGIHDSNGGSHSSLLTDSISKTSMQERCTEEDSQSIPIEFPTSASMSSKKTGLCVKERDNIGETETAESHLYHGHQSVEDGECSHPNGIRHSSSNHGDGNLNLRALDFCGQKELKAHDDSTGANSTSVLGSTLSPHDSCKRVADAVVKEHVEHIPIDNSVGYDDSGTSVDSAGSPTGMENRKFHTEDDSQYEDGEVRESVLHDWGMDVYQDGEDEHVDYGSDEKENYMYEDSFDSPASAAPQDADNIVQTVKNLSERLRTNLVSDRHSEKRLMSSSQLGELDQGRESPLRGRHLKSKDGFEGWERCIEDTPPCSGSNSVSHVEHFLKGNGITESTPCRKQLPVGPEITTVSDKASCFSKPTDVSDAVKSSEPGRNVTESNHPWDMLLNGDKSSEMLHAKDGNLCKTSRAKKFDDSYRTVEINRGDVLLQRKAGPTLSDRQSNGYSLDESRNQWNPNPHDRHRYYGTGGHTLPTPKNAVEAAAAKVESNGFAVAPDGTVVGQIKLESTWSSRRNHNASAYRSLAGRQPSSNRRDELSRIERDDVFVFNSRSKQRISRHVSPNRYIDDDEGPHKYQSRMLSSGRKDKYDMQFPGERFDSSLRNSHTIYRRDHSPSQRDSSIPRHRGRSLSRSRTRSPLGWSSPSRNGNGRISGDQGFRHYSRSPPVFRSDDRVESVALPYRRAAYVDRPSDFAPSFRYRPNQPSRRIRGRKDSENSLGRREYRIYERSSERAPTEHHFSPSLGFDESDPGRMDPDGYFRQLHSGRHREFIVAGKRSRYNDDGDRRHGNRYEMLISSSPRQLEALGKRKRLGCDDSGGFVSRNARVKTDMKSKDQDAFRGFLGGCVSQLGSSPWRSNEEKGHLRYGREIRHPTNSKSSGIQEYDKDANLLRRLS